MKMLFECMQLAPVKFDNLTDRDTTMLPRKINNPMARPRGVFTIPAGYSGIEAQIRNEKKDLTYASTAFSILDLSPSLCPRPCRPCDIYLSSKSG